MSFWILPCRLLGAVPGTGHDGLFWFGAGAVAVAGVGLALWWLGGAKKVRLSNPPLGQERFRQLFDNTPVQILVQDFTQIVEAFSRLRVEGVTDLISHLTAHPGLPHDLLKRLRLADANQPAIAAAGFADKAEAIARFSQHTEAPFLEVFNFQLGAFWAGRRQYGEEFRYLDAAGQERACLMQCRVEVRDGQPDFSQVVLVLLDVTTAKRTATAKMENQQLLRQILARANILMWWAQVRREGGRLRWKINIPSQSFDSQMFQLATAMNRGGLWDGDHVPDLAAMTVRSETAILDGSPSYQHEFRVLSDQGATHWVSEDVGISRLGEDEWSLIGVSTDVTARHQAEEGRKESDARLQGILTQADCLLWQASISREGSGVVWRNFAMPGSVLCKRLFGDSPPATGTGLWYRSETPDLPDMNRRSTEAILSGAPGYEQEFLVLRADRRFWLHEQVSITPVAPGDWSLVGVITDVTAQHEAEEARKATEARLHQILVQADCLLWQARVVEDAAGKFGWHHYIPPSNLYRDLFGEVPAEHREMCWSNLDIPHFPEMAARSRAAMRANAPGYEQEFQVRRPVASLWLHEQVAITPIGPREWNLIGVITNVTARHEAEEARKASEAQLQQLLSRADCMLWQAEVAENKAGVLDWSLYIPRSNLHRELFGNNPSEHPNLMWSELNVPELTEMNARSEKAVRSGAPGYEQEFHARRDDRLYWLHEQVSITSLAPGRWSVVGVITNVTARREAEEARKASEAQLQQILDRADCLLWRGRVTEVGGKLAWMLEIPASGLQRRVFGQPGNVTTSDLYSGLTVPELAEMQKRSEAALRSGAPSYEQEFRVVKPERTYWLHERVSIAAQGPGQWGLFGVMIDVSALKDAEQIIRASEARYRELFESAVEGVYQSNQEGRFLSVNPSLARIFGCATPEEFMAWTEKGVKSLYVRPGRREEFFAELGGRDSVADFESEVYCRGGTTKWISENVRAVRDAGGQLLYLQGFLADVTERRKALAALQQSEVRYRALFENIPVAILEIGLQGTGRELRKLHAAGVTDLTAHLASHPTAFANLMASMQIAAVNATAVRLFKAESKEYFEKEISRFFTMEAVQLLRAFLESIWQGRNDGEMEMALKDFAGGEHDAFLRWWMPRQDEWLRLEHAVVAVVDLTELKRAESALAAEKERLTVTLRAMSEGVITTDTRGTVQFMNRAAAALTQNDAAAAVGQPIADICILRGERSGAPFALPINQVLAEGALVDLPVGTTLVGRNGATCLVEGCCAPVHDAGSDRIGTVLVIRDVTVRQRFEAELERASRLESIGILAGGIAHDFNNILTAVMGNITLAQLDAAELSTVDRYLREAERATLRARDLTQQLLTFAKGGDPVRSTVLLPEIIREVAEFALHGSRVKCDFDLPAGLWPADADKGQLGQVVQNLVINAVQAMPEGGAISIAAANETITAETSRPLTPGDYVHISVADTGTGIKAEHVAKIFDPYFTTKQQGSGLGLTTVYSIIRKHQGHIEVASELGRGTTFHFWLPAQCERQMEIPADQTEAATPMKGRVLFMDDEAPIVAMAGLLLRRLGLEVEVARDGNETVRKFAAAKAAGQPFDLVVLDLTIPGGMGGREAIEQLRQIDPGVRAIVSSGYSSDPVLANYRAFGFRGMVAKPYKVDDFARVLREVLRESRSPLPGASRPPQKTA
jgi:PAS domain S-box-containing protein